MDGKLFLGQYLIWLMILLGQLHGYKSCIEKERMALLEIKKYLISITLAEESDSVLTTWTNDTNSDCCQWNGVECNRTSGRVTKLAISIPYLKDSYLLNLSLLHPFEEVRSLNLSHIAFSGLFDDVEGYKSLGRLRSLKILDLSDNRFKSSIFTFLNSATTLTALFLRSNYMYNPFPAKDYNIRRLRNLEILDLSHIQFNNSISHFLGAATSLTTLFLRGNNMDGPLPAEELKDFTNLELLDLSENSFNGSLQVQELSALRKLKALDLSNNEFSASMGLQGICELRNIQELDISRNKLVGQFPLCLTSLSELRILDLSSNQLIGNVPSALRNLEFLEYLSLSDNNFEGLFSIGSLANLSELTVFKLGSRSNSLQVDFESSWKPKFQLSVIALSSCNLEKVPHFLIYQKDLSHVDLSDNKISGIFPHWLLENNTKLKVLFLQNNLFSSFQQPKSAHNLLFLDVSVNQFNHLFPENIGWILPNLRYMNISNNGFHGDLPSSLGNMERIKYLDMSHNFFHGTLPRIFIMGCYSMSILTLSHNKLSGQVFPESANFTRIRELSMDNNQFTGKIGQGLRKLELLDILDISNNSLTGVIPSWNGELPKLSTLMVGNNMLHGEIPILLFNISNLELMDLSANILSGDIPPYVNSTLPVVLQLQDNQLSGVIPDTLLMNVAVLDLRNNRLSGNIPEFIDTRYTHTLLLRGNNLIGSIPRQLCGLRNIQLLDLSNNMLSGSIPLCLSNTSFGLGMEDTSYEYDYGYYISISDTGSWLTGVSPQKDFGATLLEGKIFKSHILLDPLMMVSRSITQIKIEFATKHRYDAYIGGNLKLLFGLDLSENELSGEILVELGGLVELQALNLSHNKLSGVIPKSFSDLKNVESLDLSFNMLQGRIPPQLTELSSLAIFNVSYNNLSGDIPQGKQFNTFDTQTYLSNHLLCGLPTNISCHHNNFQEQDNGVKDNESQIDMVSFYWSFAAAYVTILLGIFGSLSFDSPWSRYWFYIVDAFINKVRNLLW